MTTTIQDVFTPEERKVIDRCIAQGAFNDIVSALESIGSRDFSPEKELAIQNLLNNTRPIDVDVESDVRLEMQAAEQNLEGNGRLIESPEQEAEWQTRIDAERKAREAALKDVVLPNQPSPALTPDDPDEVDMTKQEIMDALTSMGVEFKPTQSKSELVDLLQKQVA